MDSEEQAKSKKINYKLLILIVSVCLFLCASTGVLLYLYYRKHSGPQFGDNNVVFYMIPHSHDDLGWLVTERQYSDLLVTHIIRSSATYLNNNPNAKFSFCNIGFLKHWTDNDPDNFALFKKAVASGQMEILNGGLSVHDNAASYFDDIISTYEYGREYVKQNFNYNPRTGWLIDPFGLTLSTSRLYAEMGYDQYVTNRIANWERTWMRNSGQLQKYWVVDGKPEYTMWISEMADHYQTTGPMNVDFGLGSAGDDAPNMNILDPNFNFNSKMNDYLNGLLQYTSWFPNPNLMIPWGGDFYFKRFDWTIQFLDGIKIFGQSQAYTGRWATQYTWKVTSAEEYFQAVRKNADLNQTTFVEKHGDFMPYIENDNMTDPTHISWTGYYVSTPYAKKVFRSFGESVRGLKSLLALWTLRGGVDDINVDEVTSQAERSHWFVGINTHHDTITGTSKIAAANSYVLNVDDQFDSLNSTFNLFLSKYMNMDIYQHSFYCNIAAPYREGAQLNEETNYMFISQGGSTRKIIRFWSIFQNVSMTDRNTNNQIFPYQSACNNNGVCEHVFMDTLLTGQAKIYQFFQSPPTFVNNSMVDGKNYSTTVAGSLLKFTLYNGTLIFQDDVTSFQVELHQYLYNKDSNVSNSDQGKYIFTSSDPSVKIPVDVGSAYYVTQVNSTGCDIFMSLLNGVWVLNLKYIGGAPLTHRYSVRLDSKVLTLDRVMPNTNFVVKYFTTIQNGPNFVTDSNGLEKMNRVFGINTTIIDENYYPLTRFIYIQDQTRRFSVMIDRAQGGSSTQPGMIEVMINRRTETDDGKGAGEGIQEPYPISTLHYLVFETLSTGDAQLFRQHQVESDNPVMNLFVDTDNTVPMVSNYGLNGVPGLTNPLLRVLFDRRKDGRLMARFYNFDEINSVTLDLQSVITNNYQINAKKIRETGIDFNYYTADMNNWTYKWSKKTFPDWNGGGMTLKPLQIRTFEIWI